MDVKNWSLINETSHIEGDWRQGAEDIIWTSEGINDKILERNGSFTICTRHQIKQILKNEINGNAARMGEIKKHVQSFGRQTLKERN
jgi:hypothetical protein